MAAGARKERKVVTVVFADLVGFTARAETLDPEDVEAILRPYHARLREELERYGGTVDKFIGGAVLLRAAEERFAAGSRAEGEAELERALAFWRSVGASGYLDEAGALAAASCPPARTAGSRTRRPRSSARSAGRPSPPRRPPAR